MGDSRPLATDADTSVTPRLTPDTDTTTDPESLTTQLEPPTSAAPSTAIQAITTCTSARPMLSPDTVTDTVTDTDMVTATALGLMSAAPSTATQDTTCTSARPM